MKGIRNFKTFVVSIVLMIGFCSVGFGQEWEKYFIKEVKTNLM
jgi:hypothetical protein